MIFGWRNSKWMRTQQRWRRLAVTLWCRPWLQYSTWCFVDVRVRLFKFIAFESVQFGVFMSICTIVRMHARTLCFRRQFLHMNYNFVWFCCFCVGIFSSCTDHWHWPPQMISRNFMILLKSSLVVSFSHIRFRVVFELRFIYLFSVRVRPNHTKTFVHSTISRWCCATEYQQNDLLFLFFFASLSSIFRWFHTLAFQIQTKIQDYSLLIEGFPVSSFKCR